MLWHFVVGAFPMLFEVADTQVGTIKEEIGNKGRNVHSHPSQVFDMVCPTQKLRISKTCIRRTMDSRTPFALYRKGYYVLISKKIIN